MQERDVQLTSAPQSLWLATTPASNYPTLAKDITVDVAVVGGGLAGISTAWFLKQEGYRVVVLEADGICQGTTGHSTAKITAQHDLIYVEIITQFGEELAQQYADANQAAVRQMAELVEKLEIDCDFQWKPAYVYTQQDDYVKRIEKEAKAATRLGIEAEYLDKLDLPFPVKAALRFPGQARFHPRKYVLGLARQIPGQGSEIYEQTKATAIEEGSPASTVVTDQGFKVKAEKIVLASHFPFHDGLGLYFARMYPERSYILALRCGEQLADGMYVTAEDPGRSLRSYRDGDEELLMVGGEHHKTAQGQEEDVHYENLLNFARDNFPIKELVYRWSAQDYTTVDKLPYIGAIRPGVENFYVATGFRKWGISSSTVAALLIRDLIKWGNSPWQDVFSPGRGLKLNSLGKLVSINANVAKELVAGKLKSPDAGEVAPGEAKVVVREGRKYGAYRDEGGQLHVLDITCTHLGCELKWNAAEKTWDCPCHGSRFSYQGEIVEGPALKPLQYYGQGGNDIDSDII
jgi:glycine/D-amino acid oxidase-like deaminating enzyme/nitrite reductase/ring-hydroxylating ferredoxin subunit